MNLFSEIHSNKIPLTAILLIESEYVKTKKKVGNTNQILQYF